MSPPDLDNPDAATASGRGPAGAGPDIGQALEQAQRLRHALYDEQVALAQAHRERLALVLAGVGMLGLLMPAAVRWLNWDAVVLPQPAVAWVFGLVLLALAAVLRRSTVEPRAIRAATAACITLASLASLMLNGIHGALMIPLAALFLHGVVSLRHAGLLTGGLLLALIAWQYLANPDPSLPLWRIVGIAVATSTWAQWQGRHMARLGRAQQGAMERLDALTQSLAGQLSLAQQARQRAERALWSEREAQSRAQAMKSLLLEATESMSHGLAVIDDRQRVVDYNARFATLLELPASFLDSRPTSGEVVAFMNFRGDFGASLSAVDAVAARDLTLQLQGAPVEGPSTYVRRTLQGRYLEIATHAGQQGFQVRTVSDITEHIRLTQSLQQALHDAQAQLVRAERLHEEARTAGHERDRTLQWLTAAMQAVSHGLMIKNDRGVLQFTNPQLSYLLRLPPDYFDQPRGGMDILKFQLERGDFREDSAIICRAIERAQTLDTSTPVGEKPRWVQELPSDPDSLMHLQILRGGNRLLWEAGDGRFIQSDISVLPSGGYVQVFSDVTELALTRKDLQASLAQLRQAEQAMQSELTSSREKVQVQGQFVAAVSHELRTPLNGIAGMTALLRETPLDATQAAHLHDLQASVQQLRRLTDELLDLARASAPGFELEATPFDLYQPIRACVSAAKVAAKGRAVSVRMVLAEPSCTVRGDPLRLAQIINNLLANALKFTAAGEVSLTAAWSALETDTGRVELQLVVADSGRGIDPSLHEAIFEPFHQGPASTNRTHGGTGLGLALCRQIVTAMQGRIEVHSATNQGATFTVTIPLALLEPAAAPTGEGVTDTAQLPRLDGFRLLVADDNRVNQKLMRIWLTAAGAEVTAVHDGAAAVRQATESHFDAILMDVAMPGMTGLEATRHLREREQAARDRGRHHTTMPIVGVTALARAQDREACLRAGMAAHLSKPVERACLLQTLRVVLDEHRWARGFNEVYDNPDTDFSGAPDELA